MRSEEIGNIYITKQDQQKLAELMSSIPHDRRGDLAMLIEELDRAIIVEPQDIPKDVVTMNSRIEVEDTDSGELMTLSLVYPDDLDLAERKISIFSPIGTAIIGYKVGDVIEWPVPSGTRKLRIRSIQYQPEAAGDYHL
jgi:regulator of nucleoside diphosphate kinase